jgi:hypothetical protein
VESAFSKPITELPAFLSTISMVVDDRSAIIQSLVHAERKSPPRYLPARDHFFRILEGDFDFSQALDQARKLQDETERKCAVEVLKASEDFLRKEQPARVSKLPEMAIPLPNNMKLAISPVWLRHFNPERLLVLHFWEQPLLPRQLSAAAAALKKALLRQKPEYALCDLDFITVSLPENASRRQFRRYSWTSIKPLAEDHLARFWKQLGDAWTDYQRREPRKINRRREPSLFD